jgi:hypothetical protein
MTALKTMPIAFFVFFCFVFFFLHAGPLPDTKQRPCKAPPTNNKQALHTNPTLHAIR